MGPGEERSGAICGIAGIVDFRSRPPPPLVDAMTGALAHRGPDHQATFVDDVAGLGHRRLAIIDLSERGNQPMVSHDGRHVIVFNGEVYNFPALRAELAALGERFTSTSDTEVVLATFRRYGPESFVRLNGMFALAIWDRQERRLTLARDRFGQKPLFLLRAPKSLVFGSEIKALLASGRVGRDVDFAGLAEFAYFGNALGSRTLFKDVRKLTSGHWMTFDETSTNEQPFWSIDRVRAVDDTARAAEERVRALLDASVARHLVSDVPVGVFLSGGVDSSAVTLFATKRTRLSSYSVGFDFGAGELPQARRVANRAGSDHHELHVRGPDLAAVIRSLVVHHDQPFGDAANIPLYLLAERLKGEVKVVLGGDGGDEMFAGYRRYNVLAFEGTWRRLAKMRPALECLPPSVRRERLLRFLRAAGEPDSGRRMALLLTEDPESPSPMRLFGSGPRESARHASPFERYQELDRRLHHLPPVQRMLHTDASILLPDIFCEKVDRSTMAHGLEVRLPFLDTELCDYVLGLPWQLKVRRLEKKWILRRALRGVVPDEVLDAPKRGFGVPYGAWLRGPLRGFLEDTILGGRARREGWIDPEACRQAIDEHASGRLDHGFSLYKLLCFAIWVDLYL